MSFTRQREPVAGKVTVNPHSVLKDPVSYDASWGYGHGVMVRHMATDLALDSTGLPKTTLCLRKNKERRHYLPCPYPEIYVQWYRWLRFLSRIFVLLEQRQKGRGV